EAEGDADVWGGGGEEWDEGMGGGLVEGVGVLFKVGEVEGEEVDGLMDEVVGGYGGEIREVVGG
ncbi:hypothetical protein, partial [Paenibacillus sp. Y412MC10]|uniref:hypothetical protein n=1 Tax=Geobacillus sp. (strain Y412MC10) TaxID=481743 RepID=UPI001C92FFAA